MPYPPTTLHTEWALPHPLPVQEVHRDNQTHAHSPKPLSLLQIPATLMVMHRRGDFTNAGNPLSTLTIRFVFLTLLMIHSTSRGLALRMLMTSASTSCFSFNSSAT